MKISVSLPFKKVLSTIVFLHAISFLFSQKINKIQIDSLLDKENYTGEKPGFSVMVFKENERIYSYQTGFANIEKKIPITDSTLFALGSVTKQFTAACIFLLEEEGKLSTDDSIQKYLPELPYFGKKITIQHLLSHTSGIPDLFQVLIMQGKFKKKYFFEEATLEFYKDVNFLMNEPGESFAYSNSGYRLLAIIVERVSGMKIGEYVQKNIFDPLQMHSAKFVLNDEEGLPDQTLSYELRKNKFHAPRKPEINPMGATGVYSNLYDFLKWDQNFYHNALGKKSKEFIRKMETAFIFNDGNSSNYGGGIILRPYYDYLNSEHSGGWNYFAVQFRRLPEIRTTVMVAANTDAISFIKLADKITDLVIDRNPISDVPILSEEKRKVISNYWKGSFADEHNVLRKLVKRGDSLCITKYSDEKQILGFITELKSTSDSTFILKDQNGFELKMQLNLKYDYLKSFSWEGGHYFQFNRTYTNLSSENFTSTKKLKGTYYFANKTKKVKIKIKVKRNGNLKLKPVFFIGYDLENLGVDYYRIKGDSVFLRFTEDEIILGNDWVYNLKLKKKL